jgi:hypothetical protein
MNKEKPTPRSRGKKMTEVSLVRSAAAEYSTFVAALYDVSVPAINQHLKRIFSDNELDESSVVKSYLIPAADGKNYQTKYYSLQAIIAVGFKIENERAVQFRKWANQIVKDYTIQGWTMDTEHLPVMTTKSCILIGPEDLAPRVSGTVMDYEQYPVIGRTPPRR